MFFFEILEITNNLLLVISPNYRNGPHSKELLDKYKSNLLKMQTKKRTKLFFLHKKSTLCLFLAKKLALF
jgi:hypothetical protein